MKLLADENTPPVRFEIDLDLANEARLSLGIKEEVNLCIGGVPPHLGLAAMKRPGLDHGPYSVMFQPGLPWRMASFALWHELGHVRQCERDFAGDDRVFNDAYFQAVSFLHGSWIEQLLRRSLGPDPRLSEAERELEYETTMRQYHIGNPYEAEAHLTAYENEATVLTRPGDLSVEPFDKTYELYGSVAEALSAIKVDMPEVVLLGEDYRKQSGR